VPLCCLEAAGRQSDAFCDCNRTHACRGASACPARPSSADRTIAYQGAGDEWTGNRRRGSAWDTKYLRGEKENI
jgi:hypothetical protein